MARIQLLRPSDLSPCAKLYVLSFNSEPWNDTWNAASALRRLKDIFNTPRFYGLVCTENELIIGALLGNLESWYHKYHYNLKEIFVDPRYQHQSHGNAMLERALGDLKKRKASGIYLLTSSENWVADFYEKNGFESVNDMQMMKLAIER